MTSLSIHFSSSNPPQSFTYYHNGFSRDPLHNSCQGTCVTSNTKSITFDWKKHFVGSKLNLGSLRISREHSRVFSLPLQRADYHFNLDWKLFMNQICKFPDGSLFMNPNLSKNPKDPCSWTKFAKIQKDLIISMNFK